MASASGHSTVTPSCNRLLQQKWDDQKFQTHRERLRTMKSSVNNGPPRHFGHIKRNLRKQKLEDDRLSLIDRHNQQLLTRMHHIMHTTGRVDHRNSDWRPKRSLGYVKRQEETERIQRDNQAILRRIQTVKPQYSTRKWESDFMVHQTRTRNLSFFPPIVSPPKAMSQKTRPGEILELPPIDQSSTHQDTQPSEIQEEIDVED